MFSNKLEPLIISNGPFDINTYEIKHVDSTLYLDKKIKDSVDTNWKDFLTEAKKRGGNPWNGTFYRIENLNELSQGENILKFSTIRYSEIRGLTYNVDLSTLEEQSRPNHVSTGSLIITSDNYFIFGVRNNNSMSTRAIDFIGGGLQKDELVINKLSDIFANQVKEIKEEIGVHDDHISKMIGLGLLYSTKYCLIFMFYTRLDLSRKQVQNIFGSRHDDEMQSLEFIEEKDLESYLKDKGSYRPLVSKLYKANEEYINQL